MELLRYTELKERESTLDHWLMTNSDDHFHWIVVKSERDYFRGKAEELDELGLPEIEVRCATACYSQIKKGNL